MIRKPNISCGRNEANYNKESEISAFNSKTGEKNHKIILAGMVELVDTRDLKSLGRKAMTVRFRLPAYKSDY